MKLKPKSTVKNPKALVYKRFISLDKSLNLKTIYKTTIDNVFWTFDSVTLEFDNLNAEFVPQGAEIVAITSSSVVLKFQSYYFYYNGSEWQKSTTLPTGEITLLSATFNNIAKYQTNKYYYSGSFDYMIKGSIEGTTTQYIKGNIIPLTALNIKYFDDIELSPDDLVVIDKHLYSVENPEVVLKQQPKPYKIYFATLNNIL